MAQSRGLAVALICLAFAGLSCDAPKAHINDVGRGRARIIAVDGQPVERARSKYVTMVPEALVKPGPHTFRVTMRMNESDAPEETLLVSGTVAAGKHYRFDESGAALQLAEEHVDMVVSVPIAASGCDRTPATVQWQGHALQEVRALAGLPPFIRAELGVGRKGVDGVADRGRPFNITDVADQELPMRRFLTAGRDGGTWLVALEHGGRGYSVEVFLFSEPEGTPKQKWVLTDRPKTLKAVVERLPVRENP